MPKHVGGIVPQYQCAPCFARGLVEVELAGVDGGEFPGAVRSGLIPERGFIPRVCLPENLASVIRGPGGSQFAHASSTSGSAFSNGISAYRSLHESLKSIV